MKRIALLTCVGSLALALTAFGAPKGKSTHRSAKGGRAHSVHAVTNGGHGGHARMSRHFRSRDQGHARISRYTQHRGSPFGHIGRSRRSSHAEAALRGPRKRTHAAAKGRAGRGKAAARNERNVARAAREKNRTAAKHERNIDRTAKIRHGRNVARAAKERANRIEAAKRNARIAEATRSAAGETLKSNRQKNLTLTRKVLHNRAGKIRINNDWHRQHFNNTKYAAFYNYNREWHDRSWWHNHYSRITFVLNGWWYWNAGYWYPAWGYDPYAWYWYDGPIYTGHMDLTPDQIMINVQIALRDWGYYTGAIDGILGPKTRAALAAFQADNGLLVTSAVDRPTLQTLGLT